MIKVVHLGASRCVGGPELQVLGLATHLPTRYESLLTTFPEAGLGAQFVQAAREAGIDALSLQHDFPRLRAATREVSRVLRSYEADLLCCHGYKATLVGRLASWNARIPAVAVSHGWTGESLRVRTYEAIDRRVLRLMDCVVGVSSAQAARVRKSGVRDERVVVVRNAVDQARFRSTSPRHRAELLALFDQPPHTIVAAVGRLSPEKGFDVLIRAAKIATARSASIGFVVFGEGAWRARLEHQLASAGLQRRFVLPGFRADLPKFFPHFDILALSSHTEGLPSVVLEAFAAGVPVVATSVGGVPEVVEHNASGCLVGPGDAAGLAEGILTLAGQPWLRAQFGARGRRRVVEDFSFERQASDYQRIFDDLLHRRRPADCAARRAPDAVAS